MQRAWVHDRHYSVARHPRLAISVLLAGGPKVEEVPDDQNKG